MRKDSTIPETHHPIIIQYVTEKHRQRFILKIIIS